MQRATFGAGRRLRRAARSCAPIICGLSALALAGCLDGVPAESGARADDARSERFESAAARILASGQNSEVESHAANAIVRIEEGDYAAAVAEANKALKLDTSNSFLNFLAGMSYHLIARSSDSANFELAEQGYLLAVKFDRSNWIARFHLGLLYLDQRRFREAQDSFAETLLLKHDDPDVLYNMVVASYFSQDPETADAVHRALARIEPDSPRVLRSGALISASLGDRQGALAHTAAFSALDTDPAIVGQVQRRVDDWARFYAVSAKRAEERAPRQLAQAPETATAADIIPAEATGAGAVAESDAAGAQALEAIVAAAAEQQAAAEIDAAGASELEAISGAGSGAAGYVDASTEDYLEGTAEVGPDDGPSNGRMVIVDVVIIRTEENYTTAKGVNLLNGLQIRFGTATDDAFTYRRQNSPDGSFVESSSLPFRAITSVISVPAITYSLNIANANDFRNEVLARPTLTAVDGKSSTFFSGVRIKAAALPESTGGVSEAVEVDELIGVLLRIRPKVRADEEVDLNILAERTFLNAPNVNIAGFANRIETSKTTVTANVRLRFGETLILSGLSEREGQNSRDAVPGLGDIPGLQYLFSRKSTLDFNKSVLILVTPRSPEFVYKKGSRNVDGSESSSALDEFRARFSDWFRPYPSWASVFHHMQANQLYREFRTGDVAQETWENRTTRSNRIRNALDFLYF